MQRAKRGNLLHGRKPDHTQEIRGKAHTNRVVSSKRRGNEQQRIFCTHAAYIPSVTYRCEKVGGLLFCLVVGQPLHHVFARIDLDVLGRSSPDNEALQYEMLHRALTRASGRFRTPLLCVSTPQTPFNLFFRQLQRGSPSNQRTFSITPKQIDDSNDSRRGPPLHHAVVLNRVDGLLAHGRGAEHGVGHHGVRVGDGEEHDRRPNDRRRHELQPPRHLCSQRASSAGKLAERTDVTPF